VDIEEDQHDQWYGVNKRTIEYAFVKINVQIYPFKFKETRDIESKRCTCHDNYLKYNFALCTQPRRYKRRTNGDIAVACDKHNHPENTHVEGVNYRP
jgi:hypothetical protein